MKKTICSTLDILEMGAFMLSALIGYSKNCKKAPKLLIRSLIGSWGGGLLRDIVLICLLGSTTTLAILHSPFCWLGAILACFAFFRSKSAQTESWLNSCVTKWMLALVESSGTARFLTYGGRKSLENFDDATLATALALITAIGGGLSVELLTHRRGQRLLRFSQTVFYLFWFFLSWLFVRIDIAGYDGMYLTAVFMIMGSIIGAVSIAISKDSDKFHSRYRHGESFSFKIGLYLSPGKRFQIIKNLWKGCHPLCLQTTIFGCLTAEST